MSSIAFERALAATARIACLASVAACGAAQVGPGIPEFDVATHGTAQPGDYVSDDYGVPVDTCDDVIDDLVAGDWEEEASEREQACCEELLTDIGPDNWEPPDGMGWEHVTACCRALDEWGGRFIACSPWGPPAPPEMPRLRAVA